jgi:hypothetical protein
LISSSSEQTFVAALISPKWPSADASQARPIFVSFKIEAATLSLLGAVEEEKRQNVALILTQLLRADTEDDSTLFGLTFDFLETQGAPFIVVTPVKYQFTGSETEVLYFL